MATKRIEGYAQDLGDGTYRIWEVPFSESSNPRSTTFVSDTSDPPKCYTEDQVKAMLMEMGLLEQKSMSVDKIGPLSTKSIVAIAAKHGITL